MHEWFAENLHSSSIKLKSIGYEHFFVPEKNITSYDNISGLYVLHYFSAKAPEAELKTTCENESQQRSKGIFQKINEFFKYIYDYVS